MKKILYICTIIVYLVITPLIESTQNYYTSTSYNINANIDDNIDEDE